MWKSLLLVVVSCPLAIALAITFWVANSWQAGLIAFTLTVAICLIIATLMLFSMKTFSLVDVFLPFVFSVVWSIILMPFSLGTSIFSAPTAIGSGLVLTLCLWRVHHNDGQGKQWLILPTMVYLYEMSPIYIPGPFDDIFGFGGTVANTVLFYASESSNRELAESVTESTRHLNQGE